MASKSLYAKDLAPSLGCHWIAKPLGCGAYKKLERSFKACLDRRCWDPGPFPLFPFLPSYQGE